MRGSPEIANPGKIYWLFPLSQLYNKNICYCGTLHMLLGRDFPITSFFFLLGNEWGAFDGLSWSDLFSSFQGFLWLWSHWIQRTFSPHVDFNYFVLSCQSWLCFLIFIFSKETQLSSQKKMEINDVKKSCKKQKSVTYFALHHVAEWELFVLEWMGKYDKPKRMRVYRVVWSSPRK